MHGAWEICQYLLSSWLVPLQAMLYQVLILYSFFHSKGPLIYLQSAKSPCWVSQEIIPEVHKEPMVQPRCLPYAYVTGASDFVYNTLRKHPHIEGPARHPEWWNRQLLGGKGSLFYLLQIQFITTVVASNGSSLIFSCIYGTWSRGHRWKKLCLVKLCFADNGEHTNFHFIQHN